MSAARIPVYHKGRIVRWALVDLEHAEAIRARPWLLHPEGYAFTARRGGKGIMLMHHVVAGKPHGGRVVSHRNGRKLDNRSSNLATVTQSENALNTRDVLRSNNRSGLRGVHRYRHGWRGHVTVRGKRHYTAVLGSKHAAGRELNSMRRRLNVPEDHRVRSA